MSNKNAFTEQEKVNFEQVVQDFAEDLVYTETVKQVNFDSPQEAVRADDVLWRPMAVEVITQEGEDQTGNFAGITEMAVPIGIDRHLSVPLLATASELRNKHSLQQTSLAARKALASGVNDAIRHQAAFYGSIVDVRAGQAKGFDDVASMMIKFDEQGVPSNERFAVYSTRDMVKMASDMQSRPFVGGKPTTAFEKAYINNVAGFELLRDASAVYLGASTATQVTVSGANQRHRPRPHDQNLNTKDKTKVDNRYMVLNVNVGGGALKAGDAFSITGVKAVHHKNKAVSQDDKTFRVVEVISPTQIKITPAIVCDDYVGATDAETAYKNVNATPADGAAITILNKQSAFVNTAFVKGALEIIPATLGISDKDGWHVMQATLPNGLTVYYMKQPSIDNLKVKTRWDVKFGVGLLNTEMAGIQLFNQG